MTPAVRKAVSDAVYNALQEGIKEGCSEKRRSTSATETQIEAKKLERKQKKDKKKQQRKKKKQKRKKLEAAKAAKAIKAKPQASESELRDAFPEWMGLGLPLALVRNIASSGFQAPTPIQTLSIPLVYRQRRDVIGMCCSTVGAVLNSQIIGLSHTWY